MIIRGSVRILGDQIDTDQLAPYPFGRTWDETVRQIFPANKEFVRNFSSGDIIVAGKNFGCGSSREPASENMKSLGASAIVADSIARTFYRNCVSLGLPCVVCPGIGNICVSGDVIEINLTSGKIKNVSTDEEIDFAQDGNIVSSILKKNGLSNNIGKFLAAPMISTPISGRQKNQTMAEKVLARASGRKHVLPGEEIIANVDRAVVIEFIVPCVDILDKAGIVSFWDPKKVSSVITLQYPAPDPSVAELHKKMRKIATEKNLSCFYGHAGIVNQVVVEKGDILPGQLIVGTDSHSTTYGVMGAAGTGLGITDMAQVLATGQTWFRVPESIRFTLTGRPQPGVMSKDVILYLIGKYGSDFATYKSIEFRGDFVDQMSIASRTVMSNMGVEMGAKFSMFPADEKVLKYLNSRTNFGIENFGPDEDACYEADELVDVSKILPQVAKPHSVENVVSVQELIGTKVDQVFLGSCTNARLEDLAIAAKILDGKKISETVRMIVTPASNEIMLQAMKLGYISILTEAGASVTTSNCGACPGGNSGVVAAGEICLSTSNRNFKGRMGSSEASIYLASPATAAISAIAGEITDPTHC